LGNQRSKNLHGKDGLSNLDESYRSEDDYQSSESARYSKSDSISHNSDKEGKMQTIVHDPNNADDTQSQNSNMGGDPDDEASIVNITLITCDCCKRSFAPKIYEKHFDSDGTPKCAMASDKKRAVYDSAKVPR
jgi:hypothetical protein